MHIFCLPRSENDIRVIHKCSVSHLMFDGVALCSNFNLMEHEYETGYFLYDGIYPEWSTLFKVIHKVGRTELERLFTE